VRNREALEALPVSAENCQRGDEYSVWRTNHRGRYAHFQSIKSYRHRPGKNVDIVEQKLMKFVLKEFRQDAHHWLILHGRYTCTPENRNAGIA
jgi:endonuclease-3